MTRYRWFSLALLALVAAGPTARAADAVKVEKKEALGTGRAYEIAAQLPTMHEGRIKPIDTVAREEVKQIYTRETITLLSEDGKTLSTWAPVAAFFDWSARPKFWNKQPILSAEYLPLKRLLFADEIKTALDAIASKSSTAEADRTRLKALMERAEIAAGDLRDAVRDSNLPEADGKELLRLADKVGEKTHWVSPDEVENAAVTIDGKAMPFLAWIDSLQRRGERTGMVMGAKPKMSELETKGHELGVRIAHYRAIRDNDPFGVLQLLAAPHPANETFLQFMAETIKKYEEKGPRTLTNLEREAYVTVMKYLEDVPGKDQAMPGTNKEFDARFLSYLRDRSAWIPLGLLREAPIEELAKSGYPASKVEAFRAAFTAFDADEAAHPGKVSEASANALIAAARDLGTTLSASAYPTTAAMTRESHFNEFAPFFKAPMFYGAGFVALILSLAVASSAGSSGRLNPLRNGFYGVGMLGLICGILLEVYGFVLRVLITGWAPVTNMYETVIWVALVVSVLGLVIELIYRKTYAALGASAAAMFGTFLASTVPLLDPTIHSLPPVLRNNFWLSIHVLTIVSSYGAFALAWILGMVGSFFYLTATYKRSASFLKLASPLLFGLPLLGSGIVGGIASYGWFEASDQAMNALFWVAVVDGSVGGLLCGMAGFAILGEVANRIRFRDDVSLDDAALAGSEPAYARAAEGGVATLTAPVATRPKLDARAEAMKQTAATIKPISNFIYRAMQVGVLLVAAGTFLGGWWADVSWGRFWGWDPKEVWALITLLVYLIPLHGRFAGWVNTFGLVMASVVCFLSVLMAWYGVNFVLGVGLHSYGFGDNGGQGTVGIATLVGLSYAAGAFWRRRVSSIAA
jgi:ABC-type transport system involved in cytochrome c biogenesis permease subunit